MAGLDGQGSASGPVCTAANPTGASSPTSPLVQIEGKKIADQVVAAREKQGTPNSKFSSNTVGKAVTNACSPPRPLHKADETRNVGDNFVPITSQDPICVNGVPYTDAEKIPGNEPTLLKDAQGNTVVGPDNQPVYGPSRGINNLDPIRQQLDGETPAQRFQDNLHNFAPGKKWDYQRQHDDDGSIIFMEKYRDFANIAIGYGNGDNIPKSEGMAEALTEARNAWRLLHLKPPLFKDEPKDERFTALPKRLTVDYAIGRSLRARGLYKGANSDKK